MSWRIPKLFDTIYNKKLNVSNKATISFRPKGTEFFYLSSRGSQDKMCVVNLDLQKKSYSQNAFCEAEDVNDLNMHGKIQLNSNMCDDDTYVVHLHGTKNILSYACLLHYVELSSIKRYFPELDSAFRIADNLQYVSEYEQEIDGMKISEDVNSRMIENDLVLLTNHGIVAKGHSPKDIVDMIEEIDYYCGIAIHDSVRMYQN